MKKRIGWIFILAAVVLCGGCGQQYLEDDLGTLTIKEVQKQKINAAQSCYSNSGMADDGNGYYFFVQQENFNKLCYYEKNMEEAQPLCSKANCEHQDESCDACYLNNESLNSYIWYHNTSLYRLEQDENTGDVWLVSFETDGTGSKRVAVLWHGDNLKVTNVGIMRRVMVMHQGTLYYPYQADVKESICFYRQSVDGSGEREKIGELSYQDDGRKTPAVLMDNNKDSVFYNVQYVLADGLQQLELYQYNIHDKTMHKIISEQGTVEMMQQKDSEGRITNYSGTGFSGFDIRQAVFDQNGYMYTYASVTGKVYRYDLSTQLCEEIYQAEGYGVISFDGANLYLLESDVKSVYEKGCKITVIDTQGKELRKFCCIFNGMSGHSLLAGTKKGTVAVGSWFGTGEEPACIQENRNCGVCCRNFFVHSQRCSLC